jgi:hypothetical protein
VPDKSPAVAPATVDICAFWASLNASTAVIVVYVTSVTSLGVVVAVASNEPAKYRVSNAVIGSRYSYFTHRVKQAKIRAARVLGVELA